MTRTLVSRYFREKAAPPPHATASRAWSAQAFVGFLHKLPLAANGKQYRWLSRSVAFIPHGKGKDSAGFRGVNEYALKLRWPATAFERHRKALAAAILIAGGVGLMLAALPL